MVLTMPACSHSAPAEPGRTDSEPLLQFALTNPSNPSSPDAQYTTRLVGMVADANGCLTIRNSNGDDVVPVFPTQITAARTLGHGDIVVLRGAEQGYETREETIARLRIVMPPECPTDLALFNVTTTADDPLIPGSTNGNPPLGYAWQDPFTFDRNPTRAFIDNDTVGGTVANHNGCLTVESYEEIGTVLPVFPAVIDNKTRTIDDDDDVYLAGHLGVIEGDTIKLVHIDVIRGGGLNLTTSPTPLGFTAGLRIPKFCPNTQYLWIVQ